MYLKYLTDEQTETFINTVIESSVTIVATIKRSSDGEKLKAHTDLSPIFNITDFECKDVTSNKDYHKQWYPFVIHPLDKIDTKLANRYVNDLHDYLEQGTIVDPAL